MRERAVGRRRGRRRRTGGRHGRATGGRWPAARQAEGGVAEEGYRRRPGPGVGAARRPKAIRASGEQGHDRRPPPDEAGSAPRAIASKSAQIPHWSPEMSRSVGRSPHAAVPTRRSRTRGRRTVGEAAPTVWLVVRPWRAVWMPTRKTGHALSSVFRNQRQSPWGAHRRHRPASGGVPHRDYGDPTRRVVPLQASRRRDRRRSERGNAEKEEGPASSARNTAHLDHPHRLTRALPRCASVLVRLARRCWRHQSVECGSRRQHGSG